jgi:hypothetical protein
MISFELAGTQSRAAAILASWDARARLHAAFSLGLDYAYLLSYASSIGIVCAHLSARLRGELPAMARLGIVLAVAQIAAALADAAENYALWQVLLASDGDVWPSLARACAIPKFGLVAAGLVYVLLASAALVVGKIRRQPRT